MQKFSLHTHTSGFDGKNSEEEMVNKAIELGWKTIGFSNHFIVHPSVKEAPMYVFARKGGYANIYSSSFDEAVAKFENHYQKIDDLKKNSNIQILKGMEVDFFSYDGWKDGFDKAIAHLKPDYLIGAAHFICYNGVLFNSHDIKNASVLEQKMLLHKYWQNERAMARSQLFDIIAHMDLMKKVGLGKGEEWLEEEKKTVAEIKKSGAIVELNASYFKFADEPYPSKRIMNMLANEKIPVLLSDDAHWVSQLGREFSTIYKMAKDCGISNFCDVNVPRKNNLGKIMINNTSREK